MLKVTVDGKDYLYQKGCTLKELAEDLQSLYEAPIVLAYVNGSLRELFRFVPDNAVISFVTTADKIGLQTYKRSCSMLFFAAVADILGMKAAADIMLHFSVDNGFFYTFGDDVKVTKTLLARIDRKMRKMVEEDLPFSKRSLSTSAACEMFAENGMEDKSRLFRTRLASRVNVYRLNEYEDYNYGFMMSSTGMLSLFELIPYHNGVVLQMPSLRHPNAIEEFSNSEKLFKAQTDGEKWADSQNIRNVGDLNNMIIDFDMRHMILNAEALQESRISQIAETIYQKKTVKFVMIAGPSSSGKTTFSQRLCVQLMTRGMQPHYIGVDNYFKNRDDVPLDAFGQKDFESLRAVDLELFEKDMTALLNGKTIKVPTFDFISGKRVYNGSTLALKENELLVIEGIHGLNDQLCGFLPSESKHKIYISALTQLNVDNHNRIPTTDGRILRRIVRDYRTRGYSASQTLAMWDSVRRGEEQYIFPFQESADEFFNSALPYELAVLKLYAEPLLFQVREDDPNYMEAKRLLKFLDYFLSIPFDDVPSNSILREFIGGGCFHM